MTGMIDSLSRRSGTQRVLIALLLAALGLFLIGMAVGVVMAMIEKGEMPSRLWVAALPFVTVPLGIAAAYVAWRLVAPPKSASGYEKRYWRTMLIMIGISVPVGILLAMTADRAALRSFNPFASTPIAPSIAILLALLITGAFLVALVLYHRAIDDHEERAYLWGSQIAYYFLILAFPAWWLLERGGIVQPITTASAFIAILISFVVQAAVWAWLKFR
jgi:hypothetical protein